MAQTEQRWNSRIGLILAMAGSAVGLGNFLRFPIQAIQNGGGAFIIPYLVSFFLLGIPLAFVEWATGKYGAQHNFHSSPNIMSLVGKNKLWKYVGVLPLFSSLVICSYYCFIESWILSYVIHSIIGTFNGLTETQVSAVFDSYIDLNTSTLGFSGDTLIIFLFCLFLNIFILSRGISKGIELVAKITMPLLLIFGLFLVYKACTMHAGIDGAKFDSIIALNFLWTPQFDSLLNPKVWLSAAGQVFFTLSLGMGAIQTYASYMKKNEDIALNSMTSAFTNEFCEILLGGTIIIPIAIGFFGIDRTIELASFGGFSLGFRTMPYLFSQWGDVISALAGVAFFGMLFFASITSSLSISQPFVAFLSSNYNLSQKKGSYIVGAFLLVMSIPCVLFFNEGVFDQYDYWGSTISLFVFATIETIGFSWCLGIDKGWKLLNDHADLKIPTFYKFVLKYVTPAMLIIILLAALVKPKNDDWSLLSIHGWEVDNSSIIGELSHKAITINNTWFADEFYADCSGKVTEISNEKITIGEKSYSLPNDAEVIVNQGDMINFGDVIYKADVINSVFYIDMCRIGFIVLLILLTIIIHQTKENNKIA